MKVSLDQVMGAGPQLTVALKSSKDSIGVTGMVAMGRYGKRQSEDLVGERAGKRMR